MRICTFKRFFDLGMHARLVQSIFKYSAGLLLYISMVTIRSQSQKLMVISHKSKGQKEKWLT